MWFHLQALLAPAAPSWRTSRCRRSAGEWPAFLALQAHSADDCIMSQPLPCHPLPRLAGSMWVKGACPPCSELIAGCALCERCTLGSNAALNKGVRCGEGGWAVYAWFADGMHASSTDRTAPLLLLPVQPVCLDSSASPKGPLNRQLPLLLPCSASYGRAHDPAYAALLASPDKAGLGWGTARRAAARCDERASCVPTQANARGRVSPLPSP